MKQLTWKDVVVTIAGMGFLLGVALIAKSWGIDGKLLLGVAIGIACLANTDILKTVIKYLPKRNND